MAGCDDEYASSLQLASQIPRRSRRRIMAGYDDEGHGRTQRRRWWCGGWGLEDEEDNEGGVGTAAFGSN